MILSGLKTWLETGELLTTPGSLMYASPGLARVRLADASGPDHADFRNAAVGSAIPVSGVDGAWDRPHTSVRGAPETIRLRLRPG